MTLNFLQKIFTLLVGSILLFSCKKTLDINIDPTTPNASQVQPNILFPSGAMWVVAAVGGDMQLLGSIWAQHYTQNTGSNQYNTIDQYNLNNSNYTRVWSFLYAGAIADFNQTIEIAEKQNKWNYWIAANLMKAYTYHILTDTYGDIPFTESNKGTNVLAPKLDNSKSTIYPDIIKLIDETLAKKQEATTAEGTYPMGISDIVFQGNIDAWVRFANTLKLKILMRDFTANQALINSLLSQDILNQDAKVAIFINEPNKSNPLFENDQRAANTTANLKASVTTLNYLQMNNDTRISFYYKEGVLANGETPGYIGIPQGAGPKNYKNGTATFSGALLEATDPVYFISLVETQFMVAECYTRLGNIALAKNAYDSAMKVAFKRWGLDATPFITTGGVYELTTANPQDVALNKVLTQKWIASVRCQAWNAFMDINRTGIPKLGTAQVGVGGYVLGELVPSASSVLSAGQYPKRMLYPKTSSDYNVNATEAIKKIITDKLWWQL